MTDFWTAQRVLVTGGAGFLGKHIVRALMARKTSVFVPTHREYDLRFLPDVNALIRDADPTLIIHAAGNVGGIGANQAAPADLCYDNLMMGAHLLDAARQYGVEKFVTIGTTCEYPRDVPQPLNEADVWNGYPEATNAPYAIAKRALLALGQAYRQQYGMSVIHLLPANLYGEGDSFDPIKSHVIPALIRRFIEARDTDAPSVTVWGSGRATRELLHAADAAEGIVLAAERYNDPLPVNLGSGVVVTIADLAGMIADAVGYLGRIAWDMSKPDGQPQRQLDTRRAREMFDFTAQRTDLKMGLRNVVRWYEGERQHITGVVDQ